MYDTSCSPLQLSSSTLPASYLRGEGSTTPVHLTDTCHWHLYDSFDAYSQHKIDLTFRIYQEASHCLSILRSSDSASTGSSRSVTDTHLVWDTGASIGLTPFCSDFIDYLPLDGITVKDIAQTNTVLGIGTVGVYTADVLAYWRTGVMVYWRTGVLTYWRTGVLMYWRTGVLAY